MTIEGLQYLKED